MESEGYRSPHLFGLKMPEGLDLHEVIRPELAVREKRRIPAGGNRLREGEAPLVERPSDDDRLTSGGPLLADYSNIDHLPAELVSC